MSTLYLAARPEWSRERLIRHLKEKLTDGGVVFHERSLRRQLGGAVESVPPELEDVLRQVLIQDTPYTTPEAIDHALSERGLTTSRPDPDYVAATRAVTLTRLWLYLHQGSSKRALSQKVSADLGHLGVTVGLDALQSELAGRGQLVRREVLDVLLGYLAEDGIRTEEDAAQHLEKWSDAVAAFEDGRNLVDGGRFRSLARLWQTSHRQASSRKLAMLLGERLRTRGVRVGLDHLQRLVSGKARRIRVEVVQAMDEMMREELGPDILEQRLNEQGSPEHALDLAWVRAQPIREMAQQWVESRPGTTMRQLALRVAETVRGLGYSTSHNTVQPILGGWKQRTRGYVYRAMLMQFEDGRPTEVPREHVISSMRDADADAIEDTPPTVAERFSDDVTLEEFMRHARQALAEPGVDVSARSLAVRAQRMFGLDDAEGDRITEQLGRNLSPREAEPSERRRDDMLTNGWHARRPL